MVIRSDGTLVLTDAGRAAAERLFAARREGLRELLADWSPEEYAELGELLTKLSRAMLGEDADRKLIDSTDKGKVTRSLRPPAGPNPRGAYPMAEGSGPVRRGRASCEIGC
jgi:hypothetical protein